MKAKHTRIVFLLTTIILIGFSSVNAHPLTWSPTIEMDEGRNVFVQGERISAPSMVNASDGGHGDFIRITWDSVVEASYYILYVNNDDDDSSSYDIYSGASTYYDDSYVNGGTYYYYWVKACDEFNDCSNYSNSDRGFLDLDPPSSVEASDGAYTYEIEVSWNQYSRSAALPVEVWRYDSDNSWGAGYVDTSYGSPYSDSTADPGKYYYYWVKACGDDFCSELSSSDQGYMAVETPTGVTATDGTYTDRVEVEWDLGIVSDYEVFRNTINDHSSATSVGMEYSSSFSDWDAEPGTVYYYWVKACGADLCSGFSTSDSGYRLALNYQQYLPMIVR